MRVTNNMLISNYLTNLNKNMKSMNLYESQLSSYQKITRLSDDPIGVISSMDIRSKLRDLTQYQKNVDDAQSWLTEVETAAMDLNDSVKSAYESAMQAATGTQAADEKASIAAYIKQLREHVVQTANSTYGDKYLFGGYNVSSAPFVDSGSAVLYQGNIDLTALDPANAADKATIDQLNSEQVSFEIGRGLDMSVTFSGAEVMGTGDDNLIKMLDDFYNLLQSDGSSADIAAIGQRFKEKQNDILALVADVGGRSNRLELVANRYESDELNYETIRSGIEDIDPSEVIMNFKMAESVYNAALSVGSQVLMPSLMDFLN
ncbi:MAG: flagellar hook-associated protein FlgL [Clostridiaceae bacterium]|nr:flagellar hook-associated protein FlgL [Clostridiaceae bacterium]